MTISQQIVKSLRSETGVSIGKEGDKGEFDIDEHLRSASKKVLLQRIPFVEERQSQSFNLNKLKSKYVILNPSSPKSSVMSPALKAGTNCITESVHDGIPTPKMVLFSPDKIELSWKKAMRAGAGLANLGNTCFLNSALQCLTYTAPLANYLIHMDHRKHCRFHGQFCMLCAMQQHLLNTHNNAGQSVKPMYILKNLRMIAKHLHFGHQEDAHEFIRYCVDAMQRSCLHGFPSNIDVHIKATTVIHQIFGGYLRSRVKCKQCKAVSDTYDQFLDLSLDINKQGCVDLQRCLEMFVRIEVLQGDNAYKCNQCKSTVQAFKKFSIHRAPNVLMIQLKRFCNSMGSKISKEVSYPSKLNVGQYMSSRPENGLWYDLYAVLVHCGYSCQSGHYYAHAKAPNGQWYSFNDSSVHQVSVNQALNQEAYLLFYSRSPKTNSQLQSFKDSVNRNSMSSSYPSCKNQMSRLSNSNKDLQRNQEKEKPKFIGPQLPRNLHSLKHPRDKSSVMGISGTLPANTTSAMNINHKPLQFGFIRKSTNVSDRKITVSNKMSNGNSNLSQISSSGNFNMKYNSNSTGSLGKKSCSSPADSKLKNDIRSSSDSLSNGCSASTSTSHSSLSSYASSSKASVIRPLVSYSSDDDDDSEDENGNVMKNDPVSYKSISSTLQELRKSTSTAFQKEKQLDNFNNNVKTDKEAESCSSGFLSRTNGHTSNSLLINGNANAVSENSKENTSTKKKWASTSSSSLELSGKKKSEAWSETYPKQDQNKSLFSKRNSEREPILHQLSNEINGFDVLDNGSDMRDDEVVGSTKKVSKDKMKMMDVGSNKEIISSKSNSISSPDHAELAFIKKRKRIGDSGRSGSDQSEDERFKKSKTEAHHKTNERSNCNGKHTIDGELDSVTCSPKKKRKHDGSDFNKGSNGHPKPDRKAGDNEQKSDSREHKTGQSANKTTNTDVFYRESSEYDASLKKKAKKERRKRIQERKLLLSSMDEKSSGDSGNDNDVFNDETVVERLSNDGENSETVRENKNGFDRKHSDGRVKPPKNQGSVFKWDKERKNPPQQQPKERPNILKQLLKQSSGKAYGTKVDTWSGDKSVVEIDAQETWIMHKESLIDDWDRDYDKGKVKKVKKKENGERNGGRFVSNIFQKFQNKKNQKN